MSFLLDTNVVSEWTKPKPSDDVARWLAAADDDATYLSAVTLAELRYGIERLPTGARRKGLEAWLVDELAERFSGRLIAVDAAVADRWGQVVARRDKAGRPIDPMDAFIAATAHVHGLEIVTRNTKDFEGLGLHLINPWQA